MAFLKLTTLDGTPFIINMARVDDFASDGAGHTKIWQTAESFRTAKESFEEIENMLQIALIGYKGIVSKADIGMVVK